MKYTVGWAKRHYVYFYAVFSSPFDYKLYSGTEYQSDSTSVTVNTAKAVMSFRNLPADGRVLAKVGISSVDEEGARLNVEAEIPNWDFEGVMKQANTTWNNARVTLNISQRICKMCKSTKAVKRGGFEKFIKVHIENYMCIFFFEIHIIKIWSVSQVMHGCDYYVKISKTKCFFCTFVIVHRLTEFNASQYFDFTLVSILHNRSFII